MSTFIVEILRKGSIKKEEGRRKKEEGRRKKEGSHLGRSETEIRDLGPN